MSDFEINEYKFFEQFSFSAFALQSNEFIEINFHAAILWIRCTLSLLVYFMAHTSLRVTTTTIELMLISIVHSLLFFLFSVICFHFLQNRYKAKFMQLQMVTPRICHFSIGVTQNIAINCARVIWLSNMIYLKISFVLQSKSADWSRERWKSCACAKWESKPYWTWKERKK